MFIFDPRFTGFEWDEDKRRKNIEKHGIDFVRVLQFLRQSHAVIPSVRHGELRYRAISRSDQEFLTIIYVIKDETCRIISARKAHRSERRKHKTLHDQRN